MSTWPNEKLQEFMSEMHMMVRSGMLVSDALGVLAREYSHPYAIPCSNMRAGTEGGMPLAEAMEAARVFPVYAIHAVATGEQAGRLEETLAALDAYYRRKVQLDERVRTCVVQPIMMSLVVLAIIGVILVKVIPVFHDVYRTLGGTMTGMAGMLLRLSGWLGTYWPVMAVVGLAGLLLCIKFRGRLLCRISMRGNMDNVWNQMEAAKLAQGMATGMATGFDLEKSLWFGLDLVDKDGYVGKTTRQWLKGTSDISVTALAGDDGLRMFQNKTGRMLVIGQESGRLDVAMSQVANDMMDKADASLDRLVGKVEPALILGCSVLIGLILFSVMLPLMDVMSMAG